MRVLMNWNEFFRVLNMLNIFDAERSVLSRSFQEVFRSF